MSAEKPDQQNIQDKQKIKDQQASLWRNGYGFALLLLVLLGFACIVIGTTAFPPASLGNVIFTNTGIAMAPAAIVAGLFRVFLFKEVRYELTHPVLDEVRDRLGPEVKEQVQQMLEGYREEITTLRALRDAGVIRPYRHRSVALGEFASAIDSETSEIMIIGSSLKGLLQKEDYKNISDKLKFKLSNGRVAVKFLLTHPVVADLRAGQESRRSSEIGQEIIDSLKILQTWGVRPEHVRLYQGTPTCFAIKTRTKMLLNPYPYIAVAYDSPCLIVTTSANNPNYFYDEFDRSHFGAWDTKVAVRIHNYDQTIQELGDKLGNYAQTVNELFNQ